MTHFRYLESILVWTDVANAAKQFSDPDGKALLDSLWIDAFYQVFFELKKENIEAAVKKMYVANESFPYLARHIKSNDALAEYLLRVHKELKAMFDASLAEDDWANLNEYLISTFSQFKTIMGC